MSVIFINDTQPHVDLSIQQASPLTHITNPFKQTTFNNPTLRTFTQVGFVNNLNDGLMWGLLPALCWSYQFGQSKNSNSNSSFSFNNSFFLGRAPSCAVRFSKHVRIQYAHAGSGYTLLARRFSILSLSR
jgi:hypothetical protein